MPTAALPPRVRRLHLPCSRRPRGCRLPVHAPAPHDASFPRSRRPLRHRLPACASSHGPASPHMCRRPLPYLPVLAPPSLAAAMVRHEREATVRRGLHKTRSGCGRTRRLAVVVRRGRGTRGGAGTGSRWR
ncbi:hypothetical protein BS78_K103600 [Paspalum vaginatum]|uniref:Uncharacterized protein n=1 Tax=Paspalum vaginatum TaxID=158149 RepID=A0A9W7X9F7_9POAL|nr:hypothetical protein BS78_K103600 [Paspalum vaginatum]